ncbi:helix-turn-helix transcriptional regulator [Pseudemcibacter aquimaris]|nr:helix-turn-helix transcriptional regulator [Pseudemcibacter aquimaris]
MLRLKHGGLSQAALAEKIGATRQTVNAIEAAKYAPSLELAFKIADVFGEPLESVFEYR